MLRPRLRTISSLDYCRVRGLSLASCVTRATRVATDPRGIMIPSMVSTRLRHFEITKDALGCRATAEMWEKLKHSDGQSLYNAACMRAVTAAVFAKSPAANAARLAKEEADRAMAWLKQAVAAGYKDVEHMKKDKDLDTLRDREDFKKLLTELEARTEKKQ